MALAEDTAHEADEAQAVALLNAVLANSDDALVIVDDQGVLRYVSVGAQHLLDYDAEATVGTSIFSYLHEDDVESAVELFDRRLEYEGADLGHPMSIRHASGE